MRLILIKTTAHGLEMYQARIYDGAGNERYRHKAFSAQGVRSWLVQQGIPVNQQPKSFQDA